MKLKHFLCSVVMCFISFVSLKAQTNATFTVSVQQDWGTGYIANVTVTPNVNITTWVVVMNIQGHLATTSDFLWNAVYTNSGTQYTFTPTSGNAIAAANASVSFGFKVDNITASTPRINSSSIVNANATPSASNLPVVLSAYWSNTGQDLYTNSTYTGNVGIGKSAPAEKLDVAGNILFKYDGYIGTSNAVYKTILKTGWANGTDYLGFYTSGDGAENANEKMRLIKNGNFGIGTSMPTARLSVANSTGAASLNLQQGTNNPFWITSKNNGLQIGGTGLSEPGAGAVNISSDQTVYIPNLIDVGQMFIRGNINTVNKAGNNWISWATRNASKAETTMDLSTVSSLGLKEGNSPSQFWITSQNNGLQIGGNGATQPATGAINIDQTGNVSFTNPLNFATGKLTINNLPIVGSQWNSNGTNINYSAGNVGIGTATPSANLSIANTTGTAALNLIDGNNEPVWISSNSGTLQLGGSGTTKPSNGVINVGNSNIVFNKRSIFVNNGVEVSNYSSGQTSLYVSTDDNVFSANTSKETGDAFYLHTDKANGMDIETQNGEYAIQGENYGGKIGLSGFSANGDLSTSIGVSGESIKGVGVYGHSHSSDGAGVKGEGEQDGVLGTSWNVGVHGFTTAMGKAILGETGYELPEISNFVPISSVSGEYSGFFRRGDFAIYGNNDDDGIEPDFTVTRNGYVGLGGSHGLLSRMHFFGQGASSGLTFFTDQETNGNEYRQFQNGKTVNFTRGDGTDLKGFSLNEVGDVNFSNQIKTTGIRISMSNDLSIAPTIFTNSEGQVGINTNTIPADAKLSVNGPIYATEFKTFAPQGSTASTNFVGGSFRISTADENNPLPTFITNPNGQVGINTEVIPQDCKFAVNGGVSASTIKTINTVDTIFTGQFVGGKFVIAQGDAETETPTLYANKSGQVGINTAVIPKNFAMAINGKVVATEIMIKNYDKWPVPDYVFDKNYKLRSLSSLKSYINQNKHLPEVSSAKEIEQTGGMNIGEMQTILLKKVEELTLYILKQQEEIEALKKEVHRNN